MTCVLARLSTIRDPSLDARAQAGVSKLVISAADLALATDFSTQVKFGKNNYRTYFRISYLEFRWNHSNTAVSSHSCEVLIVIFIFVLPGFIVCRGIEGIVWFNAGASTRKCLPEKGHQFEQRGNRLTQRGNRLTQNSDRFIERGCFCIDVSPQERAEVKLCSSFFVLTAKLEFSKPSSSKPDGKQKQPGLPSGGSHARRRTFSALSLFKPLTCLE